MPLFFTVPEHWQLLLSTLSAALTVNGPGLTANVNVVVGCLSLAGTTGACSDFCSLGHFPFYYPLQWTVLQGVSMFPGSVYIVVLVLWQMTCILYSSISLPPCMERFCNDQNELIM